VSPIRSEPLFPLLGQKREAGERQGGFDLDRALDPGVLVHGGPTDFRLARLEAALPEEIIGRDDRTRVRDEFDIPFQYPFSAVCRLEILFDGPRGLQSYLGTGWIIGRRTLITAGHCVYNPTDEEDIDRGPAVEIRVVPGADGDDEPDGSYTVGSDNLRTTDAWRSSGNQAQDYGAIILDDNLPDYLGTFDLDSLTTSQLGGLVVNISGYPAGRSGTLWGHSDRLLTPSSSRLEYEIDTQGGQSGSAVFYMKGDDAVAVGIHNYGGANSNFATRITDQVLNKLNSWKKEGDR
jgi:V8-like Glu-specific endopeptidase